MEEYAAGASPHIQKLLEQAKQARAMLAGQIRRMKQHARDGTVRAHVLPGPKAWEQILRLEKKAGALPLSLRALYELLGSVNLIGRHSSLAPRGGGVCPDPLVSFRWTTRWPRPKVSSETSTARSRSPWTI